MRYGLDDKLWVVVDPTPQSTLGDILFQASLRDLSLQFKGGLSVDENPTLFTDEQEAIAEVHRRLDRMRSRLDELPTDRRIVVYCHVGQRAYYAYRILVQRGFNVINLCGGFKTYSHVIRDQTDPNIRQEN